jgi:hypothetical protein
VIYTPTLSAAELAALRDIEEVLSVYWNSQRFPRASLRLSSFAQLEKVAYSLREEGFFDAPKSFAASADALRRALGPEAEEDLRHDWLYSGRRDYRAWMKPSPVPTGKGRVHAERIGGEVVRFDNSPKTVV